MLPTPIVPLLSLAVPLELANLLSMCSTFSSYFKSLTILFLTYRMLSAAFFLLLCHFLCFIFYHPIHSQNPSADSIHKTQLPNYKRHLSSKLGSIRDLFLGILGQRLLVASSVLIAAGGRVFGRVGSSKWSYP